MDDWKRLIPGCVLGNVVELYDFILYAYFAQIIGQKFFPTSSAFITLLLALTIFSLASFLRPLGALIFGYIGDRYGRKPSLIISISAIAFSTVFIGFLPSYQTIGMLAPILLLLSRIVQGLSISGEEIGAAIYLAECAPPSALCFSASMILGSVYFGLMLASIISFITISILPLGDLIAWGWRIPFLLSLPISTLAIFLRIKFNESELYQKEKFLFHHLSQAPFWEVFAQEKMKILKLTLLTSLLSVSVYLYVVFFPNYIHQSHDFTLKNTMLLDIFSFLFTALVTFISGWLSDRVSFVYILRLTCILFVLASYPMYCLLSLHSTISLLMAQFCLGFLTGLIAGATTPYLIVNFKTGVRLLGASIAFNLSMTFFGSTAPVITLYLSHISNSILAPFIFMSIAAVITFYISFSSKLKNRTLIS